MITASKKAKIRQWDREFGLAPNPSSRAKRPARSRAAERTREEKLDRLDRQEAKLYPCQVCGVETVTTRKRSRQRVPGRSTWKTKDGTFTLCMFCSRAAMRVSGYSKTPPKTGMHPRKKRR